MTEQPARLDAACARRILLDEYGLSPARLTPAEGGTTGAAFCADGRYFLKLLDTGTAIGAQCAAPLENRLTVLKRLASSPPLAECVCAPLPTASGRLSFSRGNIAGALFPWVDGEAIGFGNPLTPREQQVAGALETEGDMSIAALEKKCGATNLVAVVRSLYDKGAIRMHEELRGNYRPRYETRTFLTREYFNEARLNEAMDKLARAPQQLALLTRYLDMSGASAALTLKNHALLRPVAKSALMHESKAGESAWAGLLKKGILAARQEEVTRLAGHKGGRMPLHSLSPAQQQAISGINTAFSTKNVCLLHGVTSCGKTEIYIHLIAEAISNGKSVLYMLPEIALTTQITQRLRLFFGNDMGVFHSKFPDSERVEIWKKQLSPNPYKLIVGVRSSLFLPMKNL